MKEVAGATLKNGSSKSCGCVNVKHGYEGTKVYKLWSHMKERCFSPKHKSYSDYGGRGITVCKEWLEAKPFIEWALENGYKEGLTLERKDFNANYSPNNCVFVTQKEQANNRRSNRLITISGETKTLTQWADLNELGNKTLRHRIEAGWPEKDWFKPVKGGGKHVNKDRQRKSVNVNKGKENKNS